MGRYINFKGIKRERFVNSIDEIFDKHYLSSEVKLDFINRFQKQIKIHDIEDLNTYLYTSLPKYISFYGVLDNAYDEFMVLTDGIIQYALSDLLNYYNYQFTFDCHPDFYVEEFEEEMDEEIFQSENRSFVFYKVEIVNIFNWFIAVANEYGDKENLNSKGVPFFELLNYQAKRWKDDYFIGDEEGKVETLKYNYTDLLMEFKEEILKTDIDFLYWDDSY